MKKQLLIASALLFAGASFAQVSFTPVAIGTNHTDRAVIDMNADFLDDVVSVSTTNIQIFYQQEDGTFVENTIVTPVIHQAEDANVGVNASGVKSGTKLYT